MSTEGIVSTDAIFWKSKTFRLAAVSAVLCPHTEPTRYPKCKWNYIKLCKQEKQSQSREFDLWLRETPDKRENTKTFLSYRFIEWKTIRIDEKCFCTWFTLLFLRSFFFGSMRSCQLCSVPISNFKPIHHCDFIKIVYCFHRHETEN